MINHRIQTKLQVQDLTFSLLRIVAGVERSIATKA